MDNFTVSDVQERLIIKNFAGMKNVTLDIGKINILIGPQATGKSVCAKLLYFFKNTHSHLDTAIHCKHFTEESLCSFILQNFETYFPKDTWPHTSFNLRYEYGSFFISIDLISYKKGIITLKYPEIYTEKLNKKKLKSDPINKQKINVSNLFIKDSIPNNHLGVEQLFIPADRSFFSDIQKNIFSFIKNKIPIDPFLVEFGSLYGLSLITHPTFLKTNTQLYKNIREILGADYLFENEEIILIEQDGRKIKLENASSGQQEIFPLWVILLKQLDFNTTVYIEEPEAHLFPTSQRSVVELLATVFNMSKGKTQYFITTHSPYIMTSFNNLIQAGQLAKTLPKSKLSKLYKAVPKEQLLDPADIQAYALIDGKQIPLKDPESELLTCDIIDEVSFHIGSQFDKLIDLL